MHEWQRTKFVRSVQAFDGPLIACHYRHLQQLISRKTIYRPSIVLVVSRIINECLLIIDCSFCYQRCCVITGFRNNCCFGSFTGAKLLFNVIGLRCDLLRSQRKIPATLGDLRVVTKEKRVTKVGNFPNVNHHLHSANCKRLNFVTG